jgi:hypothetical protein
MSIEARYESFLRQHVEYRITKAMMLYVPPLLIIMGTFGNVFSFIILRRRAMVKVGETHFLLH